MSDILSLDLFLNEEGMNFVCESNDFLRSVKSEFSSDYDSIYSSSYANESIIVF